jgi:hypothetical protein
VWCSVCVMKIMSWNVRGLGGFEKRREVCKLFYLRKRSRIFTVLWRSCSHHRA